MSMTLEEGTAAAAAAAAVAAAAFAAAAGSEQVAPVVAVVVAAAVVPSSTAASLVAAAAPAAPRPFSFPPAVVLASSVPAALAESSCFGVEWKQKVSISLQKQGELSSFF